VSGAIALPGRRRRRPSIDGLPLLATVVALAGTLAILAIALGWRGSDLPAQVFRAELIRRDGYVIWNSQWFGGHALLGYSVIAPWLSAFTGPLALGAVSGVVAALAFERILRFSFGPAAAVGALWFAFGTVTNLIVGRTTFAFGVALGLLAIWALQRRHGIVAGGAALLCSLASPLAGAFLAIAAAAVFVAQPDRRRSAVIVGVGALAPIAVTALLFPTSGHEPYALWALIWDLCLASIVAVAGWRYVVVRWGAVIFGISAVACFLVPTAVGGNISRFGQYVGGPILACVLFPRRRLLLAAFAIPLLIWQWFPAVDGIVFAHDDPSTHASYYTSVVAYLDAQPGPIGRVEIPSTYRHWEAAYAAPKLLLARGWERQLDIAYNPIFYSTPLTAASYQQWLHENGVAFVALPDARLDESSQAERALLLHGVPYLQPVWHNAHWRVWRVVGFNGLVDGGASVRQMEPDRVTLDVRTPGDLTLRVRSTSHWSVSGGGCATSTDDGWTELRNLPAGTVTITQSLIGTPCSKSD